MNNDFKLSKCANYLGKYNNIRARRTSQDWELIDPQVTQEIIKDPIAYFKSKTKRQLKALNGICRYFFKTGQAFMRQDTLAKYAGYKCRQTINRLIRDLIGDGVLASNYRHKTSCQYKVSSVFNDPQIRSLLRSMMSAFAIFPIQLLIGFSGNVTQKVSNIIYNIDRSIHLDQNVKKQCAREHAYTRENSTERKKEREVMIKQYVEDIKVPILNYQDKIQLSRYSEGAVRHALIKLQSGKEVRSPIAFMVACCKSFDSKSLVNTTKDVCENKEICPKKERKEIPPMTTEERKAMILRKNIEWERVKYLANQENKNIRGYVPYRLGTTAWAYNPSDNIVDTEESSDLVTNNHALQYTTSANTGSTAPRGDL